MCLRLCIYMHTCVCGIQDCFLSIHFKFITLFFLRITSGAQPVPISFKDPQYRKQHWSCGLGTYILVRHIYLSTELPPLSAVMFTSFSNATELWKYTQDLQAPRARNKKYSSPRRQYSICTILFSEQAQWAVCFCSRALFGKFGSEQSPGSITAERGSSSAFWIVL